ncbi:hypothetical protein DUNSADRAFT_12413 [Dunaliella salina]|uniref:Uncharacterized protein n=1 Tax=Dunaliella salina TaxID=3046 RepID=A0ABQ7GBB6_DUNSA|nr:hypothetical protein DUNSADRAFT_12413 [Dunaliella salina]|eukprot:KAF5831902.1 hypothetical protein DUNSADRAFT_12413 [Dunaliella salina]
MPFDGGKHCTTITPEFIDTIDILRGLQIASLNTTVIQLVVSPAVNAQICSLTLEVPYEVLIPIKDELDESESSDLDESEELHELEFWGVAVAARSWAYKIATFPQHANIFSLNIVGHPQLEEDYLEQLLLHVSWSPAARARLKTVTQLGILNAWLNWGVTTTLLELFPALEGRGKLTLSGGVAYMDPLTCLCTSLQDLSIHNCYFYSAGEALDKRDVMCMPEIVFSIGLLTQLQSLSLGCKGLSEVADLSCLNRLKHLRSLSVSSCDMINLDTMLLNVPLHNLCLERVRLPSGISFASSTLRILELHYLEIRQFRLEREHVPHIQYVSFKGIVLKGKGDDLHSEYLAALALSKFPLKVSATFGLAFEPGWPVGKQTSAIFALYPLKPALSLHVNALLLVSFKDSSLSCTALRGLFEFARFIEIFF